MKNKEKFAKEIVEIVINFSNIAVNKNNIPVPCAGFDCKKCALYTGTDENRCSTQLKEWAESEYVEPKVFTEDEKAILIALPKINWVARDENGTVYLFVEKPVKKTHVWDTGGDCICVFEFSNAEFKSVLWEDTDPTSREEILK